MELPKWKEYMEEAKTLKVPVRSLLHRKKKSDQEIEEWHEITATACPSGKHAFEATKGQTHLLPGEEE